MPMFTRITPPVEARQWSGEAHDLVALLAWLEGQRPRALLTTDHGLLAVIIDDGLTGQTIRPRDWVVKDGPLVRVVDPESFAIFYAPTEA